MQRIIWAKSISVYRRFTLHEPLLMCQ